MMGIRLPQRSGYLHDQIGVAQTPDEITDAVVAIAERRYAEALPHNRPRVPYLRGLSRVSRVRG
jgi:hypothetical protein